MLLKIKEISSKNKSSTISILETVQKEGNREVNRISPNEINHPHKRPEYHSKLFFILF